jgi:hypothetical protein
VKEIAAVSKCAASLHGDVPCCAAIKMRTERQSG